MFRAKRPKGKVMETQVNTEQVLEIVENHTGGWGGTIAILTAIQAEYGYLPEEALRIVASATGTSMTDIYGVATFYRAFSLHPRGKHHVCVCLGTACHVRGAQMVVEEFERKLHIHPGETTPDGLFSLETVNCLGACALGPIVMVDEETVTKVRPTDIRKILRSVKQQDAATSEFLEESESAPLERELEEVSTR